MIWPVLSAAWFPKRGNSCPSLSLHGRVLFDYRRAVAPALGPSAIFTGCHGMAFCSTASPLGP